MSKYDNAINTYLHNIWISSNDLFQANNLNLDGLSKLL